MNKYYQIGAEASKQEPQSKVNMDDFKHRFINPFTFITFLLGIMGGRVLERLLR